ncbi:MAG TPA: sulfurtransferase TusA family protein [Planctomycetota bacterium]
MTDTDTLLQDLERMERLPCAGCGRSLCGHQRVASVVLGFKDAPRCLPCFSAALAQPLDVLRARLLDYVEGKDCFRTAWARADAREGRADCFGAAGAVPAVEAPTSSAPTADVEWNAGNMGCGDLVLELRFRMEALKPGTVLRLTARDPGAPADLPAWCGMTGHPLVHQSHPVYFIRRKEG